MFGLRTVIPPILLPARGPEHEADAGGRGGDGGGGSRGRSCTWAAEHGNAQGVSIHRGGRAHAGVHVGKYAQGVGAHEDQRARFWQPIWAWEPAERPAHLFSLSCFIIFCWSSLSPVGQSRPTTSRMPSPLRSGKDITANVLWTYFSADANSSQDSTLMKTKGPSSR